MKFIILIVFLTTSTAFANTNVNISFTQQHSFTGTKLNDEAQLKSSESFEQINNCDQDKRFARIQIENKNNPNVESFVKKNSESTTEYHSEGEQNEGRLRYFDSKSHNQQRGSYNSNSDVRENLGQFRSMNPQEKQNMEFERYIQHYHSAPTVETVYESAKPKMQHTLGTSSVQESSQRVVKFERQVALPKKDENIQNPSDAAQPVVGHQPSTSSSSVLMSSSSSSSPNPSLSPSVPSVRTGSPTPAGRDDLQFDLTYNKPNYNDPAFNYNRGHSDSHFHNQFPPSVEEPQNSYGGYHGNVYNSHQTEDNYRPVEQRPVVTKTIQIAQPAIKAKKYEVRHPAIQKEFYDIEERVVIKPAGTVVVELERPSAKILKEETTLPLGHPHPAVASAYMSNRNTQSFSNIVYSNAGSSSTSSNQYSSVKPSPTYHQTTKEIVTDSKQNRPFSGESHFSTAATSDASRSQNREIVVVTDGHGNQRQISTDQFVYSRDETDKAPSRAVHNHRIVQSNISPQRSEFQGNSDNREGFSFDAEYINNSGNINLRKENKPARLQEMPSRLTESKPQPIIKHEHKIVLSPSQHNIYLSRNQDISEETAQVREIKSNVQNHRGPVVVYASSKKMPESQVLQYRNSPQIIQSNISENRVQYSAPYAQMRHHSINERNKLEKDQPETQRRSNVVNQRKSEKLVVEDKPEMKSTVMTNTMENKSPQAHIEVKIPDQVTHDMNKAIVVSSTIRPMFMDDDREQTHNARLEISVTNNGEPKQKPLNDKEDIHDQSDNDNDYKYNSDNISKNDKIEIKPDCDQLTTSAMSGNYKIAPEDNHHGQQKFMRIVEESSEVSTSNDKEMSLDSETSGVQRNLQNQNVDVNVKSTVGHVHPPGSRVIAATPAPKESTPSESFHKRRIVVNHPFQTVREVVEHEPYTNYHEIQVNEPATPAIYHSANYYQPPSDSRSSENGHSYYH